MIEKLAKVFLLAVVLLLLVLLSLAILVPVKAQDRAREITLMANDGRSTTTTSDDQINVGANINVKGVYLVVDVTGIVTSPQITPAIQLKDETSGNYVNLLVASSGVTTIGTYTYLLYPGAGSAANGVTQVVGFPLPPAWRVSIAHNDTDVITYSARALLLP